MNTIFETIAASSVGVDPFAIIEPGTDYGSGPLDLDTAKPSQGTMLGVVAIFVGLWYFMGRTSATPKRRK